MSVIPNKSNFKFQELTPITGVKPYVIRYWETEFPEIAPLTSETGEKIYARKDVEAILRVKKFLFEDKMTIPEAKARMMNSASEAPAVSHVEAEEPSMGLPRAMVETALEQIREIKAKRNW